MKLLLKDASLDGLKGSIQYCADCRKPSVHYRTTNGWPICGMCGYNPDLARFCEQERAPEHRETHTPHAGYRAI
jgi:hypothetical protein